DGPRNWSVHIGHGLHRLHRAQSLPHGEFRPHLGQFDEHDVAQPVLRVVRDAHRAIGSDPLMFFCIFAVGWVRHRLLSPAFWLVAPASCRLSRGRCPRRGGRRRPPDSRRDGGATFFSDAYKTESAPPAPSRPVRGFLLLLSFQPQPALVERRPTQYSSSKMAPESRW